MKTKVWKRVGALILALVLIVSGVPQMCLEALAESSTKIVNEFTVTGLNAGTEVYNGGSHWRIVLDYEGTFDIGGTWTSGEFLTWLNYSIDDGPTKSAYGMQLYQSSTVTENSSLTFQFGKDIIPTDGTANCKLTIKAGTWNKTKHTTTMTEDVDIYFHEYGVSIGEPRIKSENVKDVYVTSLLNPSYRPYLWLKMSETDEFAPGEEPMPAIGLVDGDWYYKDSENGIWLDGKWLYGTETTSDTGIDFVKPADVPDYYRIHPQWFFGSGGNAPIAYGERITFEGLFTTGGKAINILKSVVEWHADTGKGTSSASGTWIILPRLLELTEGTTTENGQWKIHMSHTGQLVGETGETFTGKAVVGDEEIDVNIYADGNNIVIEPPADKVPADGTEVIMTLKVGDIIGSAGSTSMICNDVTFYINKYGMSLNEPIEAPDTTGMYIQRVQQNSNGYIWVAMSKADTVEKGSVLAPVAGGFVEGKYYHDTNSGIWIDGVWEDNTTSEGDIHFLKTKENLNPSTDNYYRMHQQWYKIVNGSRIKIQGIFEASDGNTIEVETSVLECQKAEDGTQKWILLPRLLDIVKSVKDGDQWKIYMNYVGTLSGQEGEVFTAKAYIGETAYDVQVYTEGDYLVLVPDAEALPTDGTESTITLKAGDITGNLKSTSYIVNDVTFCVNEYGVSLDEFTPSYTIVENKLDPKTSYSDGIWDIYMNQSGSFLGEEGEVFEWPATIAGEEGTVNVYAKNVDGVIYFNPVIPDSDTLKPDDGKVEVVLKATTPETVTGSAGTKNELKENVTLKFDRNGLSVGDGTLEDVQMPTESMKLLFGPAGNNIGGIYFYCSQTGSIETDGTWNIRPKVIGGYKDGVCYRGDSGVYITDPDGNTTKFLPNSSTSKIPSLIKLSYSNGRVAYYIGINNSHEIETGTKVTIKGVYEWNGSYDSISETVVEWDGGQWINVTPADDEDVEFEFRSTGSTGTCTRIYLTAIDGVDTDKASNSFNSNFIDALPGEDNGVFLNGVRKKVQLYKIGGVKPYTSCLYHVVLDGDGITAEADDEIVIKGRFHSNGHIVEYKEVRLIFDGSKWTKSTVATSVNPLDADKEDANSIGFTTDVPDNLAVNSINPYAFAVGGIYVNGEYNAAAQLFKLDEYYKIDLSSCAMTFVQGDTVTIDGSVEDGNVIVEYMRTTFTYQGDGVWTLTESGIPEQPIRFELNADESYKDEDGNWKLLFTATDGLRGDPGVEEDATYSGLVALVNGVPQAKPTFFKNSESYYEVTIPNGALPENGDTYKIVIKRGMINGGWEEAGRYMQKEITLYISGERISDKGIPTGTEGVTLSYANGDETAVTLLLDSEDSMIVTTKEGATIVAANESNSGVFINGVKQSTIGIFKFEENSSNYYYVPFDTDLYQPTEGDVIVVNGTFEMANYYVTFDAVAMKWNGSSWAEIEDLSSIALNDVEFDASDDAFLIETSGTTVDGEAVFAGTVLYAEGEYSIVYAIGNATMTQKLKIVYNFTSEDNNGAGKADTTLPTEMVTGSANAADQYITKVQATTHGTTVISMDRDNSYVTETDFDDYGLDYVVDINMDDDREFKVLQLADTQTLDSEQQTRSIGATLSAQTVPEKQFENMQYYIDKVVEESKPDIILIAGDVIYGEFDDNGSRLLDLIEYMDSLQIPWAPIFGNHDPEPKMGLDWQCEQLMNSTYCLFNRRHEGVGGNGNYSIGLARNGRLEKVVYMLDSNGCGNVERSGNTWSTWGYDENGNMTEVRAASGFYQTQIEWYKKAAMRVNAVAKEIIPSIQCYHIGTEEVVLAARAAGYQYGDEQAGNMYAFSSDQNAETYLANGKVNSIVRPQSGDLGYKMGSFSDAREAKGMLEIMNAVGTTGVFLGHNHNINTSMSYGGVRWTYGLKTGIYADDTVKKGATLITMTKGSDTFDIRHIYVELEYSEPSLDADKVAENTASVIYLNGNATRDAMSVQTEALVVSKDAESGIFINAVKSEATVEKYAEDKYKVTLPADASIGDVVSIYGIFDNSDGTHGVYFQKTLVLKYDGMQWSKINTTWTEKTTVTLEPVAVDYSKVASYKLDAGILPTRIGTDGVKTDATMNAITTYGESNVKYILDNVVYDRKYVLYNPGDVHVDEDLNVLDLVAMKKAENGEEAESLTEQYAAQLGSEGLRERLVRTTEKFIITGLNADRDVWFSGNNWRIHLDSKGYEGASFNFDLGGQWKNPLTNLPHSVNNGPTATNQYSMQFYQQNDGTICLQVPGGVVPSDGTAKTKLTIKAFTNKQSGSGLYTYSLMEDFTLYFDGKTVSFVE